MIAGDEVLRRVPEDVLEGGGEEGGDTDKVEAFLLRELEDISLYISRYRLDLYFYLGTSKVYIRSYWTTVEFEGDDDDDIFQFDLSNRTE